LLVGTAGDAVPVAISRQKTGPKAQAGNKSMLTDDVELKLAEYISSDLDIRYVLVIAGRRNKEHTTDELLALVNDYITPSTIGKPTLNKWLAECIVESVEWEEELTTDVLILFLSSCRVCVLAKNETMVCLLA
jgi:hypothetical protein